MNNLLLVAVLHGPKAGTTGKVMSEISLMGSASEALFVEQILPRITDETVIYLEGKGGGKVPESFLAKVLAAELDCVSRSGKKPKLVGLDPRVRGSLGNKQRLVDDTREVITFLHRWSRISTNPASFADVLSELKKEVAPVILTPVDVVMKMRMKRLVEFNNQFTQAYSESMRAVDGGTFAILIAGGAHCLDIHLATDIPLVFCMPEDQESVSSAFLGYLNTHAFPRQLIAAKK